MVGATERCFKSYRDNFEAECECILNGKFNKIPVEIADIQAVRFYELICKCSCNDIDPANSRCGLEVVTLHMPEKKGLLPDYWQAWVNGVQDDGCSQHEAVMNAYNRFVLNGSKSVPKFSYLKQGGISK